MNVSGHQFNTDDNAGPTDTNVSPQTVVGLVRQFIVAKTRKPTQSATAIGTRKATNGYRKTVHNGHLRVKLYLSENMLPQLLFGFPQIARLAGKRDPMHLADRRKPITPVSAEVLVDGRILIPTKKLAYDFHRQYFAIAQFRSRPSLSQFSTFKPVIHNAKDTYDNCGKIHLKTSLQDLGIEHHESLQRSFQLAIPKTRTSG
jgi:hypothetical protein